MSEPWGQRLRCWRKKGHPFRLWLIGTSDRSRYAGDCALQTTFETRRAQWAYPHDSVQPAPWRPGWWEPLQPRFSWLSATWSYSRLGQLHADLVIPAQRPGTG